jgi:hypothetical protein
MDNVTFQCGNCQKLMAVNPSFLGQQVRCPHCQQVVLAPAPASPTPANPVPEPATLATAQQVPLPPADAPAAPPFEELKETHIGMPGVSELESIFGSPEANSDALFGDGPRGLVEMPLDPAPPQAPAEQSAPAPPPVLGLMEPTLTYHPNESGSPDGKGPTGGTGPEAGAFTLNPNIVDAAGTEVASTAVDSDTLARAIPPQSIRAPADKGGWFIALLVVPLISYSILATIAVVYLRFFQAGPSQPHPLEMIPDVEGENPGVKHVKKRVSVNFHGRQEKDLPSHLRTVLGQRVRIGDLEVTPTSLELRRIEFAMPGKEPEPSDQDCLVLNLHLKNVSNDLAFCPLDPFFYRQWIEPKDGSSKAGMPFTYLTVGKQRFYGGPIGIVERAERHETIKGQQLSKELGPGDEMDSFVCTDPTLEVKEAVEKARSPMLWRIQVRRGLAKTPNRGEVPATAVIGVEFTREDIKTAVAER